MRFVFYFALECSPGWEAQQDADADAPTAHVVLCIIKKGVWSRGKRKKSGKLSLWHAFEHYTSPFAVFTLGNGASGGHLTGALHSSD